EPRLCGPVETDLSHAFTKTTASEVSNVIAQTATDRSPNQNAGKTVITEERTVRQHARQKECDVSLQHDEKKNRVKSVLANQFVEKVKIHETTRLLTQLKRQGYVTDS